MSNPAFTSIRACVFDAYGTLFNVHSAIGRGGGALGDNAQAVSDLWRQKQLERPVGPTPGSSRRAAATDLALAVPGA